MSAERADRLEVLLGESELDALLVTGELNVRYLTGFRGDNAVCVVGPGLRLFVTDFRYVEQARSEVGDPWERIEGRRELVEVIGERLPGRVGFEEGNVTVRRHDKLASLLGEKSELVAAGDLVERLRAVKQPDELDRIRASAALADRVYEHLCSRGLVGRTEREVALGLEAFMREQGAEGPSFPSIVAAGPHGALPHASPRDASIDAGTLVVVDLGCVLDGYCSDCTRTFATGRLSEEAAAAYELVLDAQQRALEGIRAGADRKAVDAIARDVIDAGGHGEHFGHSLGHGVGIEVHEGPTLAPTAEGELVAGNVVTVEPGIYVPGAYGVRIEDLVVVTDDGAEILSRFPKHLITLGP